MTLTGVSGRLRRDAMLACLMLAGGALLVWPRDWRTAAGVLGGGVLIGLSAWAIRGVVDGFLSPSDAPRPGWPVLVKFFTRHAILALAAYGMMARLKLDPVGMLVGVSSLALAAGLEAARGLQARDDGGSSR